jgi:hypothetical protein
MNARSLAHLLGAAALAVSCAPPREFPPHVPPRDPQLTAANAPSQEPVPACVRFWPEARQRNYQYDHIVHLNSRCHRVASCEVSTDVSPTVVVVSISPDEHREVVTALGTQAPEFTPNVRCAIGTR